MLTTTRRLHVSGPADPGLAWQRYLAPVRWPGWAPHLVLDRCSTPEIEPGTTGRLRALGMLPVSFRVDVVDRARREWAWTVRSAGMRLHLRHGVRDDGHGGSVATLAVTGPAPVVLGYLPVARWALGRLVGSRRFRRDGLPATAVGPAA